MGSGRESCNTKVVGKSCGKSIPDTWEALEQRSCGRSSRKSQEVSGAEGEKVGE